MKKKRSVREGVGVDRVAAVEAPGIDTSGATALAEEAPLPWWAWIAIAAAAFVTLLIIYGPALRGDFLFDDIALKFRAEPDYFRWSAWRAMEGDRPLSGLSYWLSFQAGGGQPLPFHLASLLMHAGAGTLLAYILLRLLTLLRTAKGHLLPLALLGAGLFLVHPAQSEGVAYVAAHPEPLSVFFYFAALAVFLSRREPHVSWPVAFGTIACFLLAMLSKEHALTLPAVLVLLHLWAYRQTLPGLIREGWRLYSLMAVAVAVGVAVVLRTLASASTAGFGMADLTWWEYLLTQGRAILLYLRLWVLPVGQNGDYLFPISRGLFEHWALLCWLLVAAGLAVALRYRRQAPLVALGAVLFLLVLGPTSSVLPIQDAAVERRVYLAALGLVPMTLGMLMQFRFSASLLRFGGIALLLVLSVATYQRSKVWATGSTFWADVLAKNPDSWRANVAIGLQALEANRCAEALALFERAKPGVASNYQASWHANQARALDCLGRTEEAEAAYLESLKGERSAAVLSQLGVHYGRTERYAEALAVLDEAIALSPDFPPAWSNRGNIHARQGDCTQATADFQHALQLMPSSTAAQRGLAYCREQLGR
ncbi:MAG: tetratricopeptide repeat protein [Bryobacterales bacterium]|nr:tetratricopeptide repeat protein [Bryobacterales bacterium]